MSALDWTEILVIVAAVAAIVLINWYFLLGDRTAGSRDGGTPRSAGKGSGEGARGAANGGEG